MDAAANFLREYTDYLTFQKSYSKHTIAAYSKDVNQFLEFQFQSFGEASPISTRSEYVRSWIVELVEREIKPTSVNRKLSTLKSFYKYLRMTGSVEENPATLVRNLKVPQRIPTYVRKSESDRMFDQLLHSDEVSLLETTVLALMYNTGIRRSELIDLKMPNVDLQKGTIKVFGKGKKERLIPLGAEVVSLLEKYAEHRAGVLTQGDSFFVLKNGKPLYAKWVYNSVKKMLTMFSNSEKKSPHVLRHSFATHLLQNGAEIAAIKELLGHSSLASTQIYAQSDIAHLKKIHKLHPKS